MNDTAETKEDFLAHKKAARQERQDKEAEKRAAQHKFRDELIEEGRATLERRRTAWLNKHKQEIL